MKAVLLVHVAATWSMVGVIWFVQLVHYPLFRAVGRSEFVVYEDQHTRRTGWLVGVLMPIEALTGLALVIDPTSSSGLGPLIGLLLIGAIWATTLAVQVPLHRSLSRGYDDALLMRLVRSNWIRTGLWSARGLLVLVIAAGVQ